MQKAVLTLIGALQGEQDVNSRKHAVLRAGKPENQIHPNLAP